MRGNPDLMAEECADVRSIPACAGEPTLPHPTPSPSGVYPRVCGGTGTPGKDGKDGLGLSPRVRGNLDYLSSYTTCKRSIPACAGEPGLPRAKQREKMVYPRVCGGTTAPAPTGAGHTGLSPRVRGNPGRGCLTDWQVRSIPACAGEPAAGLQRRSPPAVYPRVCGGTPH